MATPRRPAPPRRKRVLGPMPAAWVPNPGAADREFVQPEYPVDMDPEAMTPWTPAGLRRPGGRPTPVLAPLSLFSRRAGTPGWVIFGVAAGLAVIVGLALRSRGRSSRGR